MWEGCPKVGSIDVCLPCAFGKEKTVAPWTKYINSVISGKVRKTHGKNRLSLTKDSWAPSKCSGPILFVHGMHPSVGDNIPAIAY
jgi:hypothetical protein